MASRRAEMAEVKSRLRLFRVSCANPPFHITISTDVNILKGKLGKKNLSAQSLYPTLTKRSFKRQF